MRSALLSGSLLVSLLVSLALVALATAHAEDAIAGERPRCVSVSAQPRFDGSGYSHWVSVEDACSYAVRCEISTDVAPSPVSLELRAGERRDVNTFLSSPASAFTATVRCERR